jgi:hypothetical protein
VDVVRLSSKTSLRTCWKIRYDSRSDTAAIMPDRRSPLLSSVCHVLEPHRSTPSNIAACGRLTGQRPTCPSGSSHTR